MMMRNIIDDNNFDAQASDQKNLRNSSINLGFFNPMLRLRRWDVTTFCMQFGNIEDR